MANHYEVLGVSQNASAEDIRRAYRQLALEYHPDRNFGSTTHEEKFREITQAYQVLTNSDSRVRYDYLLNELRNVGARQGDANNTRPQESYQAHPPQLMLNAILNLRKQLRGMAREDVNLTELYNVLSRILSNYNIDQVLRYDDIEVNEKIIQETSHFLKFLTYPHVEDISYMLDRLAGSDEKTKNKIDTYRNRRHYFAQAGKVVRYGLRVVLLLVFLTMAVFVIRGGDPKPEPDPVNGDIVVIHPDSLLPIPIDPKPKVPKTKTQEEVFQERKQKMLEEGWVDEYVRNGQLTSCYNVLPQYEEIDNYLEVYVGGGTNVAIKLMDQSNDLCIRYVFINSGSTYRIENIPQGRYYLKIAYGKEWLSKIENGQCVGKFIRNPVYERGDEVLDYYVKQIFGVTNVPIFRLRLDVVSYQVESTFDSHDISESEFNQ